MPAAVIATLVLYPVVSGCFCAYVASQKGRDAALWFFLGLVFGVLALIALVAVPLAQPTSHSGTRLCPLCIEPVSELASVCPHCQRDLPPVERCATCGKVINPGDERVEGDAGKVFCNPRHIPLTEAEHVPLTQAEIDELISELKALPVTRELPNQINNSMTIANLGEPVYWVPNDPRTEYYVFSDAHFMVWQDRISLIPGRGGFELEDSCPLASLLAHYVDSEENMMIVVTPRRAYKIPLPEG